MKAIIFGFLLHLIFLLSVFDIYFKSPIINNIPVQTNLVKAPAKRLVLFVADGLRADSFYSYKNNNLQGPSPYLRSIIENRGAWGVAHARLPTESRPGHIALIAGLYEDPSAVFTGWKDNVVEFDSLFNRSTVTYSWGSPDILPMFQKGASENKVKTFTYDSEYENFAGFDSTRLNTWVFENVEKLIKSTKNDVNLKNSLQSPGVVLFLHLLGTDVSGHANKPHSRQYRENIGVIDEGVKRMEALLNDFYENDNRTAYVYTSDHGMTDWGSHGDGSASETEVPLVVWGAGARGPQVRKIPDLPIPVNWGLSSLQRTDVAQADICPLMAILTGISIPVHSVGVLPLDYLSIPVNDKISALLLNERQLFAQFKTKRDSVEANMLPWFYRPYPMLADNEYTLFQLELDTLVEEKKFDLAILKIKEMINKSLDGLEYYHSYFETLLLCCVSLSFLGWIAWLLCYLLNHLKIPGNTIRNRGEYQMYKERQISFWPDCVFLISIATAVFLIYVQSLPLQFYIYCSLPLVLWWNVLRQLKKMNKDSMKQNILWAVGYTVMIILLLEFLVLTFMKRWVLSVVVAAVGFWPFCLGKRKALVPTSLKFSWLVMFLFLAIFPTLPVVGQHSQVEFVLLCGGTWVLFGVLSWQRLDLSKSTQLVLGSNLLCVLIAMTDILVTSWHFKSGLGLHWINQLASWSMSGISILSPLMSRTSVMERFLVISMGLAVPFLLLCLGHEAFLLITLYVSLCLWICIEACLSKVKIQKVQFRDEVEFTNAVYPDDFRRSFFFMMFLILSFFGTGNIPSISSFDVAWVRCFVTSFSPYTITALIIIKTAIPFLLVSCCFRAVNIVSKAKAENMFVIVLIYCDVMNLHFLFAVTNKGSWKQIGTSLSHFIIMEVTVLLLAKLYYIAKLYTSFEIKFTSSTTHNLPLYETLDQKFKKKK